MALQSLQDYADQVVESQKLVATPGVDGADANQWHHLTIADLICYSRRYDDIREDVGINPTALLQHYLSTGIREGRDPRCRDGETPLGEEGSEGAMPGAGPGPTESLTHSMGQDAFSLLEDAYGENRALQLYNAAGGPRTRRAKNTRANGGAPIGSKLVVTPDEYSVSGTAPDQDDTPVDQQGEAMYDAFGPLRVQMGTGAARDGGRGNGEIIDMGTLMDGGDESRLEWPREPHQPSASSMFKARSQKKKPKGGGGGVSARTRKKKQGGETPDTEPAGNMGDVILDRSQAFQCPPNKVMQGKTCQPAFLVIGAQKSGTSTLAHLMGQHPQIKKPQSKEILFFNWNNDFKIKCSPGVKELQAYFKKFPMVTPELHKKSGVVTGEWSATYLPCHCCPKTVFSAMPQTKIIVILRHPVDRAHSRFVEQTYFAKKYKKQEINNCPVWMGWDRFVDHSIKQIGKCMASIPGPKASNVRECIHHHNELGWSIYAPSLQEVGGCVNAREPRTTLRPSHASHSLTLARMRTAATRSGSRSLGSAGSR